LEGAGSQSLSPGKTKKDECDMGAQQVVKNGSVFLGGRYFCKENRLMRIKK